MRTDVGEFSFISERGISAITTRGGSVPRSREEADAATAQAIELLRERTPQLPTEMRQQLLRAWGDHHWHTWGQQLYELDFVNGDGLLIAVKHRRFHAPCYDHDPEWRPLITECFREATPRQMFTAISGQVLESCCGTRVVRPDEMVTLSTWRERGKECRQYWCLVCGSFQEVSKQTSEDDPNTAFSWMEQYGRLSEGTILAERSHRGLVGYIVCPPA